MDADIKKIAANVERKTHQMLNPNGKFSYQINVNTKEQVKGEYNLLRHFGTLWYLGRSDHDMRRAYAIKGLKWAKDKYWHTSKNITGAAYQYKNEIKTGGVALAILAKLALNDDVGLSELSDFLLSMQKDNGDFIHKLDVNYKDTGFQSEYYTGEILFALASLQAIHPDPKRIKAITKCFDYLISIGYGIKEQSHWMLHALNAVYAINHNPAYPIHSTAIASDIMNNTKYQQRGANPIGTRIEGLLSHAKIMKEQAPGSDTYMVRLSFIESNIKLLLNYYQNGYFHKDGLCQIDMQQHCGDALRTYVRMIDGQFSDVKKKDVKNVEHAI